MSNALASRICCLDLDTFFVSVERLLDPSLTDKPVIVGGQPNQRGVVTAASYEVRHLGVRAGMSLTEAAKRAPNAIWLPVRHGVYSIYADKVRQVIEQTCPTIQRASIDEFYLDLSGCERLYQLNDDESDDQTIERSVVQITENIYCQLGLPASAGIATCKQVSKVASGLAKPKGVLFVGKGDEQRFLAPLPVGKYPGIGPVAQKKLDSIGIKTLGQLACASVAVLRPIFGNSTETLIQRAQGIGTAGLTLDRPAFAEHDPKGPSAKVGSISNERTFRVDLNQPTRLLAQLSYLCERVCWRARKREVQIRTVTLKLRYRDFETITRSRTIEPTNSEKEVFWAISDLFDKHYNRHSVRPAGRRRAFQLGSQRGTTASFSKAHRQPEPCHRRHPHQIRLWSGRSGQFRLQIDK